MMGGRGACISQGMQRVGLSASVSLRSYEFGVEAAPSVSTLVRNLDGRMVVLE